MELVLHSIFMGTQKKISRIRKPRVHITYDLEIGDAVQKKELPFIIGVLADFSGHNQEKDPISQRKFIEIDLENFDDVLKSLNPFLEIKVDDVTKEDSQTSIKISFESIDHFHPSSLLNTVPLLNDLYNKRVRINDLCSLIDKNAEIYDALQKTIEEKGSASSEEIIKMANENDEEKKESLENAINDFNEDLSSKSENTSSDPYNYLQKFIINIDKLLSKQMDAILHNEEFQKLEGNVRSLHYLVKNSELGPSLKIKLLNVSKEELFKDLEKAIDFDQSQLFKKVYEAEYGTFGGNPYSCLVGCYSFGKNSKDVAMLRNISGVAAAAHAPFISALSPEMFGMKDFSSIGNPRDLKSLCSSSEYLKWNGLRNIEDSRYLSLVMPRVLIRQVYGPMLEEIDEFNYQETVDGANNEDFCWGNPAFAVATKITNAFSNYGWTAAIRGYEGGGAVENLPVYTYKTSSGDIAIKCPTEVTLTDRREKELEELGFLSMCYRMGTDSAAVFSAQTIHKPEKFDKAEATANASLSCKLPYILNVSRFAHYIKVIMRDKVGSFLSKDEVRSYLQNWLGNYVLLSDFATQEAKSKFPLREGRVDVYDDPSSPGSYNAVMYLRPHFQMEDLTVSLRLVAKLPQPAA